MEKFYLGYVEGESGPVFRHPHRADAFKEAERLAREMGKTVYLLEAIAACVVAELQWTELK